MILGGEIKDVGHIFFFRAKYFYSCKPILDACSVFNSLLFFWFQIYSFTLQIMKALSSRKDFIGVKVISFRY